MEFVNDFAIICPLYLLLFNWTFHMNNIIWFLKMIAIIIHPKCIYDMDNATDDQYIMAFTCLSMRDKQRLFFLMDPPSEYLFGELIKMKDITDYGYDEDEIIGYWMFVIAELSFGFFVKGSGMYNTRQSFISDNYHKITSDTMKWNLIRANPRFMLKLSNVTDDMIVYAAQKIPSLMEGVDGNRLNETLYCKLIDDYIKYGNRASFYDDVFKPTPLYYIKEWTPAMINKLLYLKDSPKIANGIFEEPKLNIKKFKWTKDNHMFLSKDNRKIIETLILCNKQLNNKFNPTLSPHNIKLKIPSYVLSNIISKIFT